MNSTIIPIIQSKIQNAPVVKLSQLDTLNFKNEVDSVELSKSEKSKKEKSKKALIIPSIVVLINKPRIKKIQKQSMQTIEYFREKFELDEAKTLEDGTKVIQEFSKDGKTLIRSATLDSKGRIYIQDYANKTNIYYSSSECFSVYKDEKQLIDGTKKVKEVFEFDNGKLSTWLKNYKITPDKSHLSEVSIYFKNGNISEMYKNELRKDDGYWAADKTIYSEGGKTK